MRKTQLKSNKPVANAVAEATKSKGKKVPLTGPKTSRAHAKPTTGAKGAGLATILLREAESEGQLMLKQEGSYKERLRDMVGFSREDHLEFRGTLKAKREEFTNEAEKVKLSLTKWMEADTVRRMVYNLIGMWDRMSRAVEAGYKPNYDKAWGEISKGATDKLNAQAALAAQEKTNAEIKAIEADTTIPPDVKQAKIKVIQFARTAETGSATARTSAKGRGRPRIEKPLFDEVQNLIKDRPIGDVEKLIGLLLFHVATKTNKSIDVVAKLVIEDMKRKPTPSPEKAGMAGTEVTA